ncbi:MAG: hypothetical protein HGB32_11415 [Geobacteraceae bacterium]|nr:hypothetical protein [Geobacteraceae bacterium]NTW80737.1 hypothetical protein [Geobacteraceae bacterium]
MIDSEILEINSLDDYDQLLRIIGNETYITNTLVDELKERIGLKCKRVVVESLYRDYDFSSIYSSFYSKKHKFLPKECYRIHFFTDRDVDLSEKHYGGFMVLRPSAIGDSRGRSHLKPELLVEAQKSFIMWATSKSHILGEKYEVEAFPWMAQETDISRCAHSAAWSIIRYFSEKYSHYKKRSINDIVEMTPLYLNRKTPSEGLTLVQLSDIFAAAGFHPLILSKGKTPESEEKFYASIFAYIESGIPIVAALPKQEHAISIIGHGEINQQKVDNYKATSPTLSYHFIDSLIAIDDNFLPYRIVEKTASATIKYGIEDIGYALIPLYEKMFLPADIVIKHAKYFLETKQIDVPDDVIIRPYITSSRSLKCRTKENATINNDLKEIILKTPMPQFVWCVDISTVEEYKQHKNSARLIIDVTAATDEIHPWILTHDSKSVFYYTLGEGFIQEDLVIAPYDMYKNNLTEVNL